MHQREERGFNITCGIDGCQKSNNYVDSLCRHIRRSQVGEVEDLVAGDMNVMGGEGNAGPHAAANDNDQEQDAEGNNNENNNESMDDDNNAAEQIQVDLYTLRIALFLLQMREERKVPANACAEVID